MIRFTGTGTVELSYPVFGDTQEMVINNTIKETSQGIKSFYKGTRPTWYTYSLDFDVMTEDEKDDFKTFLINNAGDFINLEVDPRNIGGGPTPATVVIPGFIRSQEHTFVTNRDGCSYSVNVTFEISEVNNHLVLPYIEECT